MTERTTILPWVVAAVIGVGLIVFMILLYTEAILGPEEAAPATAAGEEFVSGTKRDPGTWQEDTIRVQAGDLGAPDVTIDVNVAMFAFQPSEIRVKQGQVVKLVLHALDDGQLPEITGTTEFSGHGFYVGGPYDIWITGLRKDTTKEVVFEAAFAGEYEIECAVLCGVGHYYMRATLIVEETP